jgi:DNA-binding transcriptional regulator YbjK
VPPQNLARRNALADAAIALVARLGTQGLSHRAVDVEAEVPPGTASNYFRTKPALLAAAFARVVELHFEWIAELRARHTGPLDREAVIELLSNVVRLAVSEHRDRYLAMFELALESTRHAELRDALTTAAEGAPGLLAAAHEGGEATEDELRLLNTFYNGVLFTSLVMPAALGDRTPAAVTRAMLELVLTD